MNIEDISKSKMVQIESMAESIRNYFGKDNEVLEAEMTKLVNMIKEEKRSREELRDSAYIVVRDLAYIVANKL